MLTIVRIDRQIPMSPEKAQRLKIVSLPALLIIGAALYLGIWTVSSGTRLPFRSFDVGQINGTRNAEMVAISSDASSLTYVLEEAGMESLWMRSLAEGARPVRLLPPANVQYRALTFSPDNAYVYYSHTDPAKGPEADYYSLYRVPIKGGSEQKLIDDVDTSVTFSPDGRRILFLRANNPERGISAVIDASADGGDEHIVQKAPNREAHRELAWSPDGKSIAEVPFFQGDALGTLTVRDLATGKSRNVFKTQEHTLNELAWLPSGEALAMIYRSKENGLMLGQIGLVSYPEGKFQRITADMGEGSALSVSERIQRMPADSTSYQSLSVSRDGKTMASVLLQLDGSVYIAERRGESYGEARRIGAGDANWGATWIDNERLVLSKYRNLLSISVDGGEPRNFYSAGAVVRNPVACLNAGYIAVVHGMKVRDIGVWKVDLDGSNPKRISPGRNDIVPACSPDGKWLLYVDSTSNALMRMPASGGDASRVADVFWQRGGFPEFSPDSKLIAAGTYDFDNPQPILALIDVETNRVLRTMNYHPGHTGNRLAFTQDGKAVIYAVRSNGVDNLWMHPLDGGLGRFITNFSSMRILNFEFSPDWRRLMLIRGELPTEVVLLHDRAR